MDRLNIGPEYSGYICDDLDRLYRLLGLNPNEQVKDPSTFLFPPPRPVLSTSRLNCKFCPPGNSNVVPSLRRRLKGNAQSIWLLDKSYHWVSATLLVGYCAKCKADYYPDRITQIGFQGHRTQVLEYDAEFLRVSKVGIWVHRKIAVAQEKALHRFHSGWSNFADCLNDNTQDINDTTFICRANSTAKSLAEDVRKVIGMNGGVLYNALSHGCTDCTHVKRYASALGQGANLGGDADVPLPQNITEILPQQAAPPAGSPRGYARMAVMDGKSLTHKHLELVNFCGILSCGRRVHLPEALTCDDQSHIDWYKQYEARFHRLSFKGMQRVIRHQHDAAESGVPAGANGPLMQVQLQALGETPGPQVAHTFKAKKIYCLQTIQWACGVPIGWGRCYKSESTPQVLSFITKIWEGYPSFRPSFIGYDKACDLLRHIVTQNPDDLWIKSTKFIVDAFHYINHWATDVLCRTRCNPAPMDGSQPALVLTEIDEAGVVHQTRAFTTETAEQLNSWLDGFESRLQQMTDVNFDFIVHVLMLIYGEMVEKKIRSEGKELAEGFWDEINGLDFSLKRSQWGALKTSGRHRLPVVLSVCPKPPVAGGDRRLPLPRWFS
ncbi:hypothetical protein K438DRAFT_1906769 [Mycena galopus ATCC 62051]|nr:hypothetical protein K438DRAFT_1906769 [Mycena galopus ATCC 62051]